MSFPQVFAVETHCGLTLLFECGLLPGIDTAIIQPVNEVWGTRASFTAAKENGHWQVLLLLSGRAEGLCPLACIVGSSGHWGL